MHSNEMIEAERPLDATQKEYGAPKGSLVYPYKGDRSWWDPASPRSEHLENTAIRKAVLRAAAHERRKAEFNLHGRGHEPRVTLDPSVAAILRGLDIPRMYICGPCGSFGYRYYPRRVFATAMRNLKRKFGRSPIALDSTRGRDRVVRVYEKIAALPVLAKG